MKDEWFETMSSFLRERQVTAPRRVGREYNTRRAGLAQGNKSFGLSQTNYECRIDSTRPVISLPPVVYDDIFQTLGLQHHNHSEHPIVPDEAMKTLADRNRA
jgi:hypothetical protein